MRKIKVGLALLILLIAAALLQACSHQEAPNPEVIAGMAAEINPATNGDGKSFEYKENSGFYFTLRNFRDKEHPTPVKGSTFEIESWQRTDNFKVTKTEWYYQPVERKWYYRASTGQLEFWSYENGATCALQVNYASSTKIEVASDEILKVLNSKLTEAFKSVKGRDAAVQPRHERPWTIVVASPDQAGLYRTCQPDFEAISYKVVRAGSDDDALGILKEAWLRDEGGLTLGVIGFPNLTSQLPTK